MSALGCGLLHGWQDGLCRSVGTLLEPKLFADHEHGEQEGADEAEADGGSDEAAGSGVDLVNTEVGGRVSIGHRVVGAVSVGQHDVGPHEHGGHGKVLWQLPLVLRAHAAGWGGQLLHDQPGTLLVFLHPAVTSPHHQWSNYEAAEGDSTFQS